ncbi:GNAT family N-acetyltransferase [Methanotrichaceae archaeon M04Ac]|uniref:GNAT family N-acetyltransferase n=1 Tax=Candidatus Methanocrinis alkalitolerans TaxID=3033395 RepID=A0ABT5XBD9_9EURY|nr:GNAT family N-acetyltransferase [Candidatus Methanocrinis alkalitolerans]MDF0592013.1 GNAT family N-acetyltransferase [Candidatus Methanocrinis alkalitolerans]
MRIQRGLAGDLPSILAAERACFSEEAAFSAEVLTFFLEEGLTFVAEDGGLAGFVMGFAAGDLGKVATLDVIPGRRGEGLAQSLMEVLEAELASRGVEAVTLEVAVDNRGAIALYEKLGYREASLLEGYYGTGSDAILMAKLLEQEGRLLQTTKYIDIQNDSP